MSNTPQYFFLSIFIWYHNPFATVTRQFSTILHCIYETNQQIICGRVFFK